MKKSNLFDEEHQTKVYIHGLHCELYDGSDQAYFYVDNIEENSRSANKENQTFLWQSQRWQVTLYDEREIPLKKINKRLKRRRVKRRRKNVDEGQEFEVTEIVTVDLKETASMTCHLREYLWQPKHVNTEETYILVTYVNEDNFNGSTQILKQRKNSNSYKFNRSIDGLDSTYDEYQVDLPNAENSEEKPVGGLARLTYISEKLLHLQKQETDDPDEAEFYQINPINVKLLYEPPVTWAQPYEGNYGLSTSHFQLSERFGSSYESRLLRITTRGGYLSDFSLSFSEAKQVKRLRKKEKFVKPEYNDIPNDVIIVDKLDTVNEEKNPAEIDDHVFMNNIKCQSLGSDDEGFEEIELPVTRESDTRSKRKKALLKRLANVYPQPSESENDSSFYNSGSPTEITMDNIKGSFQSRNQSESSDELNEPHRFRTTDANRQDHFNCTTVERKVNVKFQSEDPLDELKELKCDLKNDSKFCYQHADFEDEVVLEKGTTFIAKPKEQLSQFPDSFYIHPVKIDHAIDIEETHSPIQEQNNEKTPDVIADETELFESHHRDNIYTNFSNEIFDTTDGTTDEALDELKRQISVSASDFCYYSIDDEDNSVLEKKSATIPASKQTRESEESICIAEIQPLQLANSNFVEVELSKSSHNEVNQSNLQSKLPIDETVSEGNVSGYDDLSKIISQFDKLKSLLDTDVLENYENQPKSEQEHPLDTLISKADNCTAYDVNMPDEEIVLDKSNHKPEKQTTFDSDQIIDSNGTSVAVLSQAIQPVALAPYNLSAEPEKIFLKRDEINKEFVEEDFAVELKSSEKKFYLNDKYTDVDNNEGIESDIQSVSESSLHEPIDFNITEFWSDEEIDQFTNENKKSVSLKINCAAVESNHSNHYPKRSLLQPKRQSNSFPRDNEPKDNIKKPPVSSKPKKKLSFKKKAKKIILKPFKKHDSSPTSHMSNSSFYLTNHDSINDTTDDKNFDVNTARERKESEEADTDQNVPTVKERITLLRQNSSDGLFDVHPKPQRRVVKLRENGCKNIRPRSQSLDSIIDLDKKLRDEARKDAEKKERRRRLAGYSFVNSDFKPSNVIIKSREYTIEACEREMEKERNLIKIERRKARQKQSQPNMAVSVDKLKKINNIAKISIPDPFICTENILKDQEESPKTDNTVGKLKIPRAFSMENILDDIPEISPFRRATSREKLI